mmetsp:Transcript_85766/g.154452  ORF Transcript_85766/g.154452 Transcript_85766/m.154452 type:complete len:217 (-) Transcript_85766:62-712(-)
MCPTHPRDRRDRFSPTGCQHPCWPHHWDSTGFECHCECHPGLHGVTSCRSVRDVSLRNQHDVVLHPGRLRLLLRLRAAAVQHKRYPGGLRHPLWRHGTASRGAAARHARAHSGNCAGPHHDIDRADRPLQRPAGQAWGRQLDASLSCTRDKWLPGHHRLLPGAHGPAGVFGSGVPVLLPSEFPGLLLSGEPGAGDLPAADGGPYALWTGPADALIP